MSGARDLLRPPCRAALVRGGLVDASYSERCERCDATEDQGCQDHDARDALTEERPWPGFWR